MRNFLVLGFSLIFLCLYTNCTDNELYLDKNDPTVEDLNVTNLIFTVYLSSDFSTRDDAGSIDDYVDTQNMFQVLVFGQNGDFLFESLSRTVRPSNDIAGQWYVTIPLKNNMVDRNNNKIPLSYIKNRLEKENFKIAILANWTELNGSSVIPYIVNWGWNNSALNSDATDKKNINDLHHLETDSYYSNTSPSGNDNISRADSYSFIMDNNKMGHKTDWVEMRSEYERKGTEDTRWSADRWIRNNWDPSKDVESTPNPNEEERNKGYYTKMWQYWNFGMAFDDNDVSMKYPKIWTDDDNNLDETYKDWDNEWKGRNGNKLKEYLSDSNGEAFDNNKELSSNLDRTEGFIIDLNQNNVRQIKVLNQGGHHGIILPETDSWEYSVITTDENNKEEKSKPRISLTKGHGYLQFIAYGTGTLRIKCKNMESSDSHLVIQRGTTSEADIKISTKDYNTPTSYIKNISITEDPEIITIFCRSGEIAIYAIEWICNKYLYDTDRKGVMPTEDRPIPMFGVQEYNKIEAWESEDILNLSSTTGRNLYLVRALAKVELYLKNEAYMVFMRSMNRMARCEPMDVETPTNQGWSKHTGTFMHEASHCEWFDIQKYGPAYVVEKKTLYDFKDWYSWFFGSWKMKRNSDGTYSEKTSSAWSWPMLGIKLPPEDAYPHIFNPDVERSDFCEFLYEGEVEGYHKYILYVPDKGIDDPNNAGYLNDTPKVAHIEYRSNISDTFLDDNKCHRIYFTDYEGKFTDKNTTITGLYADEYSEYEKDTEHLKYHWPIMRNHIYRFYVGGDYHTQEILVKVNEWGETEPKKVEW